MLKDKLRQLATAFKANYPNTFEALNPGAKDEDLQKLRDGCLGGGDLPADLEALYRWHNGQSDYGSFNPDSNRTFMPIDEVIDAWQFLNDDMEDHIVQAPASWIPFMYNGAGDYLVYETAGENAGQLIGYWHDDEGRDVEFESLEKYIDEVLYYAEEEE